MASTVASDALAAERAAGSKRSRYWVLPKLQGRFIAWAVLTSAVVGTTVAWAILLVVWSSLAGNIAYRGPVDANSLFREAAIRVFLTTGLLIIVFGLVALFVGLMLSHRVAGPLHRIGLVATRVAQGQFRERVVLRRGDYVQEFAGNFNEMLDSIEKRVRDQQTTLSVTYARLTELESACADRQINADEVDRRLQEIMKAIRKSRITDLSEDTPAAE